MDDDVQQISCDEKSSDLAVSDSQVYPQLRIKALLNEEIRKKAIIEYGNIYRETKTINKDKEDFHEILSKLKSSVHKENNCLSRFGINELLIMDAKNIALTSELSFELAKKFEVVNKFDTKQFLKRLKREIMKNVIKSKLGEINPNKKLQLIHLYPTGEKYGHLHYYVPSLERGFKTDFDTCNNPMKEKRKASQRAILPSGKAIQPEQYNSTKNINNVDESDKRLEHIFKTLRKLEKRNTGSVPFLQASLNPNDFAVTVENIFNMAFLARQSRVIIDSMDTDDFEPIIQTKEPDKEQDQKTSEEKNNIQSVFSFDMKSHEELIKKLEINLPAIK